ncbi:membrane-bound lytic murein transglycosylase C [Hydrogenivirga caldilitoris]|uniref:Membrane-bound lytic murein transglycosylase C n=1 Tax=Hydrogenivirga caldilitoris TaxID=246264 RepID=A0A497XNV3_9AQUI|nr:transglycosylase SLT domain-containing protein [Hydrogenivirga caldilitoris]RLJ70627.1 membrane-bound lytic murein transglycosylase C [Hydrogenivirga caldilitoris]
MTRRELLTLLLTGSVFAQESFKEFLKEELEGFREEKRGFNRYLEEVNREFEEYKSIVRKEFESFKREILRHWDTFEGTDKKKLVQYSPDFRTKRVFDFEKGELRVEVSGEVKNLREFVKGEIEEFVKQDKREVFESDQFLRKTEERVRKLKYIRTGVIEREPVLTPVIFGKESVNPSELKEGVRKLIEEGSFVEKPTGMGKVGTFTVSIPPEKVLRKARRYKSIVSRESERWKLEPSLVFAIIHTESYFNPLATSPVPAYGLMQIVPHSAGKDVTEFLNGRPVILSPSYLYNAENNIKVGTTYVYMLYYRYFSEVRDPESRLYCTIAAYNTGPGNVARTFTGTTNLGKAVKVINSLTPKDTYGVLLRNLPYQETKDYLRKVSKRIAVYKNL